MQAYAHQGHPVNVLDRPLENPIFESMQQQASFFRRHQHKLAIGFGPLVFMLLYGINPLSLAHQPALVLAFAAWMIAWWVFEALPMPVVAMLPIVFFPLLNIAPLKKVCQSYADPIIFLFMGGFLLAIAIEKWNLHKRIALHIIRITGTNGNRIILGFILATGFLSMWLSNTSTTMMMFPIACSVIEVVGKHESNAKNLRNFSLVLMLSIAYASNFAVGTIIGTPPNVAYAGYVAETFQHSIGFTEWMIVFTPLSMVLLMLLYWVLVKLLFPNRIAHAESGKAFIEDSLRALGPMQSSEKRVAWVFAVTVLCWIGKDWINQTQSWVVLDDTIIAMLGGSSLFLIPANSKENSLLQWGDMTKMAWGILLLFGGGIALAKALEEAKLMDMLGQMMSSRESPNLFWMILLVTTLSVFLSEVMSNVAQVMVMAPVITTLAISMHIDPLLLGIPMTLGASCASMLPMGTPPNALVFASGYIRMRDMIFAGFVLNLICILVITLFCYFIQPLWIHFH
jgi:sodium-dependent dicarboxylate transporter 2/3/5